MVGVVKCGSYLCADDFYTRYRRAFTRIRAPSHSDIVELVHTISHRIANYLEKVGLVHCDMDNSFLNLPLDDEDSLLHLQGAFVCYRIAMGPQQGQKVFTLQTWRQAMK